MKTFKISAIFILILISLNTFSQLTDPFLNSYSIYKSYHPEKAKEYKDVDGSPYLNEEFIDGVIYMRDTLTIKLPLRYNIYTDEMEYQLKGINFVVANPQDVSKIVIGKSVFVYQPYIKKGGYFELFESGKCLLVQKKSVAFKPAEGPKAITGAPTPAQFLRKSDSYYLVKDKSQVVRIENLKSLLKALEDQKDKMDAFVNQQQIKNIRKENIIKMVKYYNTL